MTKENYQKIMDAFEVMERNIMDSFDRFKQYVDKNRPPIFLDEKIVTAMRVDGINPQDIVDKELKKIFVKRNNMTKETVNTILEALEKLEHHIEQSFNKFDADIRAIAFKENTEELNDAIDNIHPQDIADKELSEKESEADYINQRDEDNYREAYQEHHQK